MWFKENFKREDILIHQLIHAFDVLNRYVKYCFCEWNFLSCNTSSDLSWVPWHMCSMWHRLGKRATYFLTFDYWKVSFWTVHWQIIYLSIRKITHFRNVLQSIRNIFSTCICTSQLRIILQIENTLRLL